MSKWKIWSSFELEYPLAVELIVKQEDGQKKTAPFYAEKGDVFIVHTLTSIDAPQAQDIIPGAVRPESKFVSQTTELWAYSLKDLLSHNKYRTFKFKVDPVTDEII